jgi:hypothetical protein
MLTLTCVVPPLAALHSEERPSDGLYRACRPMGTAQTVVSGTHDPLMAEIIAENPELQQVVTPYADTDIFDGLHDLEISVHPKPLRPDGFDFKAHSSDAFARKLRGHLRTIVGAQPQDIVLVSWKRNMPDDTVLFTVSLSARAAHTTILAEAAGKPM